MSKEKIFKELIAEFAKNGEITDSKYKILLDKREGFGIEQRGSGFDDKNGSWPIHQQGIALVINRIQKVVRIIM